MRRAFRLVYYAIAAATFSHTTWSAAVVFQGEMPHVLLLRLWWYLQGALLAVAIDVGMLVTAEHLSRNQYRRRWVLVLAFALAAVASGYTQVLYALHHATAFTFTGGVTPLWEHRLQALVDARIVILPLALPVFAIVYTLVDHDYSDRYSEPPVLHPVSTETVRLIDDEQKALGPGEQYSFECPISGKLYGPYKDEQTMLIQRKGHYTRLVKAGKIEDNPYA